ncbi:hypothetical protein AM587_10005795 [Phytophthora nicotianae]|uniref:RxLR effector protein n=3 Tax=Phytophthora nicotianae TaxID=4792 RepID=A0A0W8BZC2_PHYNI|nr:hypothetical protein AM587_10005795 [Phytophthora nicotianae]KUF97632.1 hypothetical protein AM588_10006772 [Phytophthora nicotianae]
MRFTYFLLVAAATLHSSCNASAAVVGDYQARPSAMTSTDAANPARPIDASNIKRFLRTYRERYEDDEDEEERVNQALLDEEALAKWTAKWATRADAWFDQGYTPAQIKDKLSGLSGVMSQKNGRKYYLFLKKWNSEHPRRRD